jgi:SAM-dependent methyltransferase
MELFGHSLVLRDFPKLKAIRGLGMTDKACYAEMLAEKFDYTNTYYDREPRFDFTESHPRLAGMYDFILSADVLEHVAPPVQRALAETCRLLKPHGFMVVTIYCNGADRMYEHYPDLHQYRVVAVGGSAVLVNRRRDGTVEIHDDLVFHGGSGATLEMREFGMTELVRQLRSAGYCDVRCQASDIPEFGVLFDHDVSQPLVARKQAFTMDAAMRSQLVDHWLAAEARADERSEQARTLTEQIRLASSSRWLKLGRRLGLGPQF